MLVAHHEAGDLLTNPPSIYTNEIAPYANGAPASGCQVDVRILQVLELVIRHTGSVTVSDIQRPCIGSSENCGPPNYSVHCAQPGAAIDFAVAGGSPLTGNDDVSRSIIADLDPLVPSGTNVGQVDCRSANPVLTTNFSQFPDKCNHLHIDFRNTTAQLNVTAPTPSPVPLGNGFVAAFSAYGSQQLWTHSLTGPTSSTLGVAANTSPSVARLSNGNSLTAFQANGGTLWVNGSPTQYGMAPNTSPAVVALPNGGWRVLFQSNGNMLWNIGSDGGGGNSGLGMKAGSSPAGIALKSGGYMIAFQTPQQQLYTVVPGQPGNATGLGMAAGTSPAITAVGPGGGYQIAFQEPAGKLTVIGDNAARTLGVTTLGMAPGTSPAITTLADNTTQIAFQKYGGGLFLLGTHTSDTGYGMKAGTSPSIAPIGSSGNGYEVAFQANNGYLWEVGSHLVGQTPYGMAPGSSPSIANR